MGHSRLGDLPRTRKWQEVVSFIANGAGAAQVANAVMRAAERGMHLAADHAGLVEAVWLLTQLPAAAKRADFAIALRERGLVVSDRPGLMDIVAAVSDAVDVRLQRNAGRTDLGELAQSAAVESIVRVVSENSQSLFGATAHDVKASLSRLESRKHFGELAREFFARLTEKTLQYYVSRATANHVGSELRFPTLAAKAAFDQALATHCREASVVVEEFAGDWLSKTNREHGWVARDDASRLAYGAMNKLVAELKAGAR